MNLRTWGKPEWALFFSGLGALATAVGALFVYLQISAAARTLYSSNSYTAQKDILEAADRLLDAKDQVRNQGTDISRDKVLRANQARLAIHFDSIMDAAAGLEANEAIKKETWAHILWWMCPTFSKEAYKFDGIPLGATQDACTRNPDLWKVRPQ